MKDNLPTLVTKDDLVKYFPEKAKLMTDEIVDIINRSRTEPEFQGESLLETMVTYDSMFKRHKNLSIRAFIDAIRFCAYLVSLNDNAVEAYKRTFFDRDFVKERWDAPTNSQGYTDLTSASTRYRKNRVVVDILTLSQVPLDLLFTGYRYKAVGVLADEMVNAKYSKDRINAAKELLAATKGADNMKIELDVGVTESSAVDKLNAQLAGIALKQKMLLEEGAATLNEFGAMKVVDAEYEDVSDDY